MKNIQLLTTPSFRNTMRILLMSLVLFSVLILPIGAQASGLRDVPPTGQIVSPTAIPSTTPEPAGDISWLAPVSASSELASDRSLALLAGELIFHGLVDASSICGGSGLLKSGAANPCGEQVARNAVILWQNQFDDAIFQAATQNGIPPYLLKNVIARESQFWPASHATIYGYSELGLGHITQMGADSLLRWNEPFAAQFCHQVFSSDTCQTTYPWMTANQQAMMRGAVLQIINADCAGCVGGVDLQRARASIPFIAAAIKSNYNHAEQIIKGVNFRTPNRTYESSVMWRMTLAGYNAGPGCLTTAVQRTVAIGLNLTWKNVSSQFDEGCAGAIEYVETVTRVDIADAQALADAQADTSRAAQLVRSGLGIVLPTPTLELPTATETETPTALLPESTPSGTLPAESETPTPEATSTPTQELPTATPTVTSVPPLAPVSETNTEELLVKFNALAPDFLVNAVLASQGVTITDTVPELGLAVIHVPAEQSMQVLAALENNLLVDYAEPNAVASAFYTPNDPGFNGQTSLLDMHVSDAWSLTRGDGVVVAVIDTGVDVSHPDLAANIWTNAGETGLDASGNDMRTNGLDDDADGYVDNWQGWNFVANANDVSDLNGHGTHSAGIIAASMNNNEGIAGIAPNSRIMPIKALADNGTGSYSDVAAAIFYAVDHGAQVINLGFGGTAYSETLIAATDYAYSQGVAVVAAAGNSGSDVVYYPAANPNVIAVSALDTNLTIAPFSSYGDSVDLAAPGTAIYSSLPGGGYGAMSGTSMSAASVSGVAALLSSMPQFSSVDALQAALYTTALDLGVVGRDPYYGYGLVQADQALLFNTAVTATPTLLSLTETSTSDPNDGEVNIMAVENLYGTAVYCGNGSTSYSITTTANSTDLAINGATGSCGPQQFTNTTPMGGWTYTAIQDTTLLGVSSVQLNVAFSLTMGNDTLSLQVYDSAGVWQEVATFSGNQALQTFGPYDVTTHLPNVTAVNAAQVRLIGKTKSGGADNITINMDEIYLVVTYSTPTPVFTPTFTPTNTVPPTATNTPGGPTPTNTSVGPTATYTPTATPGGSFTNPHGNFTSTTDQCAICHRTHSARSADGALIVSPLSSNDYCFSCHDGSGAALKKISTHSNVDFTNRAEGAFELLCVQCHNPHGGETNLNNIRSLVWTNSSGSSTAGPIVFTALSGTDSYDENDATDTDDLCVACHLSYSLTTHNGGSNHAGGVNYAGQNCSQCHPHSADNTLATKDGFMPAGSCTGCHATAQDNGDNKPVGGRRQIVGPTGGDFTRSSHHVAGSNAVKDTDCVICHDQSQHTQGTVRLYNVDNHATVYAMDGIGDPADYENFCLSCHDANGNGGDTTPFSDNAAVVTVNSTSWGSASHNTAVSTFTGSCRDCHNNGHGSNKVSLLAPWNYVNDGNADDGMRQEERFCYICHQSGGVASDDIMTNYSLPTVWTQAGFPVGQNALTTLNDRHDITTTDQLTGVRHSGAKIECVSCHNPHVDSPALKVIADPDPTDGRVPGSGYFTEGTNSTNFWSDWCLDCHDGSYPASITPPTSALVNINAEMSGDAHGSRTANSTNLATGTGYAKGMIVQCRQCHGTHVQAPTPNGGTNFFSLLIRVRNANNTADLPVSYLTPATYNFQVNNISGSDPVVSGGYWCNTCHDRSSMDTKSNCYECHFHGSSGSGGW